MAGVSQPGQESVRAASVLVVGAGALGSPVCAYLAGAGVGRLGIVDQGEVAADELGDQFLHFAPDRGRGRADSAASKLGFLNPQVQVDAYPARLEQANAEALVGGSDVVVDCSNDLGSARLANDACLGLGIPLVSGGVGAGRGWIASVCSGGPCLRCMDLPPPEQWAASQGPVAGVIGSLQALHALRLISRPEHGGSRLLLFDGQTAALAERQPPGAGCPACAPARLEAAS